jgi:hypothetical protein
MMGWCGVVRWGVSGVGCGWGLGHACGNSPLGIGDRTRTG